jgi:hypothetical protein
VLTAILLTVGMTSGSAAQLRLPDLDNRPIDPFQVPPGTTAIAFLFVSVECPISNRYAPEVKRVYDEFTSRGVRFWLVYPNPADSPATIRQHIESYGYPAPAVRDPGHALVKLARATVTPEAAVFDARGRLVYHGRIDDRYVELGVERPSPTTRDLADALRATLAGKPFTPSSRRAVGCFIADFVP